MSDFLGDEWKKGPHATASGAGQPGTPPAGEQLAGRPAASDQAANVAEPAERRPTLGGHPHGRPSSWALAGLVAVAFIVGGIGLILHLWWLVYTCAAVVVLSIPVGKLIGIMKDTVVWGTTTARNHPAQEGATTSGTPSDEFAGRVSGEDPGAAGETGAQRRAEDKDRRR